MDTTSSVHWTIVEAVFFSLPALLLLVPVVWMGLVRRGSWHVTLTDFGTLAFLIAALTQLTLPLHFWSDWNDKVEHAVALGVAIVLWWGVGAVAMSRAVVNAFTSRLLLHCVVLTHGCFLPGILHFSNASMSTGDNWLVLVAWVPCYLLSLIVICLVVVVKHSVD